MTIKQARRLWAKQSARRSKWRRWLTRDTWCKHNGIKHFGVDALFRYRLGEQTWFDR